MFAGAQQRTLGGLNRLKKSAKPCLSVFAGISTAGMKARLLFMRAVSQGHLDKGCPTEI